MRLGQYTSFCWFEEVKHVLSRRTRVANLQFMMNTLRAPLSTSMSYVMMWPRIKKTLTDKQSLLTCQPLQRLGQVVLLVI